MTQFWFAASTEELPPSIRGACSWAWGRAKRSTRCRSASTGPSPERCSSASRPASRPMTPAVGRRDGDHGRRLVRTEGGQALHPRDGAPAALRLGLRSPGRRRSPRATATACGPWGTPSPPRRSSTPTSRPERATAGRPARSSCSPGSTSPRTRRAPSPRRASGRPPSSRRSTATTSTTPPRCWPRPKTRSATRSSPEGFIVSADPAEHVERIRRLEAIHEATTAIVLQLIGADPLGSIRRYGQHVLPALRRVRAG